MNLTPRRLEDYTPYPWNVQKLELHFQLAHERTEVEAILNLSRNPEARGAATLLELDGEDLELLEISLDGKPLAPHEYDLRAEGLRIPNFPDQATLRTRVAIAPEKNTALSGLYVSDDLLVTQCEAEGFRRITFFPDRPDVLTRFCVTLEGPEDRYPTLLSNGNPGLRETLGNGRVRMRWEDPFPKPSYLFALVAGKMDRLEDALTTRSGRTVKLHAYTPPGLAPRARFALDCLKRAMKWDEEVFGLECDLDLFQIVAVTSFNMGAMENKGLNIFNAASMLVDPESANDMAFETTDTTVAHEYFHNFTGNRVTCRDWFQLSLKEGLTVLREQLYTGDFYGEATTRAMTVESVRGGQFTEDAGPTAHPVRPSSYVNIDNFYTKTIYSKGAELLHMLLVMVGRERLVAGVRDYLRIHDGRAATIEEFVDCMRGSLGISSEMFMRWYAQAGTPVVSVRESWDAARHAFRVRLSQRTPPTPGQDSKLPVPIPVVTALLGSDGAPLAARLSGKDGSEKTEHILMLESEEAEFVFENVAQKPVPSYLRGLSAPVRLVRDDTREELLHRLAWDRDPVARRDAGVRVFVQIFKSALGSLKKGAPVSLDSGVTEACRRILTDTSLDAAYRALMLAPLEYGLLEQELDTVEVELWEQARNRIFELLSQALSQELLATWEELAGDRRFSADGIATGRRALKRRCLNLLSFGSPEQARGAAERQLAQAVCMEDTLMAWETLRETGGDEAVRDAFLERWKDDGLVLRYWFRIEAASRRSDTLERVRNIRHHPLFSFRTPNHVRALFRPFSQNFPRYHAADGSGYRLVFDTVFELDSLNPGMAASLLSDAGERNWSRHDATRRRHVAEAMARLLNKPDLSTNTREKAELIAKALA